MKKNLPIEDIDFLFNKKSWYGKRMITWVHDESGLNIQIPNELYCYDNLKYPTYASSWNIEYFSDPFIKIENNELFKTLNLESCQCESRFMLGNLRGDTFQSTQALEYGEASYMLVELELQEDNSKVLDSLRDKSAYYKEQDGLAYVAIPLDSLEKENANKLIHLEKEYWDEKDKEYDRTTKIRKYCDNKKEEAQGILQAIQNYSDLREEFGVNRVSNIYETGTGYKTERGNVEIDFNKNICKIDGYSFDLNKPLDEVAKDINKTFSRENFEEAARNGEEINLIRDNLKKSGVKNFLYRIDPKGFFQNRVENGTFELLVGEKAKEVKEYFEKLKEKYEAQTKDVQEHTH